MAFRSSRSSIKDDTREDDPLAAIKVLAAIEDQDALLLDNPALVRPGRVDSTRELVIAGTRYT